MIEWFRLGSRVEFIESELPQQELSEFVDGLPVRVDLSMITSRDGVTVTSLNVIYDGYTLPTRIRGAGYTYSVDDKYGAVELSDGYIYLGVKRDS